MKPKQINERGGWGYAALLCVAFAGGIVGRPMLLKWCPLLGEWLIAMPSSTVYACILVGLPYMALTTLYVFRLAIIADETLQWSRSFTKKPEGTDETETD